MALDENYYAKLRNQKRTRAFNILKKEPNFASILKERSRRYGVFMNTPEGPIYLAVRFRGETYRNGEESVNLAEAVDRAAWAIDYSHILTFSAKGVTDVGVYEIETGDIYLAPIAAWKAAPSIDWTHRKGSLQKKLLHSEMTVLRGVAKYA